MMTMPTIEDILFFQKKFGRMCADFLMDMPFKNIKELLHTVELIAVVRIPVRSY